MLVFFAQNTTGFPNCFPATFPTSNMTYYQQQTVGTSQETALKYIKIIDPPERPIQKLPMRSPSHTQKGPYMNFELSGLRS